MRNDTDNTFRLIKRETCAQNKRFSIFLDAISNNDTVVNQYLLVQPTVLHDDHVSGICILPMIEGKIGLMKCYRYQFDTHIWQAPMGFIEEHEVPKETAVRELQEETGLKAGSITQMGSFVPDPGILQARVSLFLAKDCVQTNTASEDEPGIGKLYWFNLFDIKKLLLHQSGQIGGATSVLLYRFLVLL